MNNSPDEADDFFDDRALPRLDPLFLAAHLAQTDDPNSASRHAKSLIELVDTVQAHWDGEISPTETMQPDVLAAALAVRMDRRSAPHLITTARSAAATLAGAYEAQLATTPDPSERVSIAADRPTPTASPPPVETREATAPECDTLTTVVEPQAPRPISAVERKKHEPPAHAADNLADVPLIRPTIRQQPGIQSIHIATGILGVGVFAGALASSGAVFWVIAVAALVWVALVIYLVNNYRTAVL